VSDPLAPVCEPLFFRFIPADPSLPSCLLAPCILRADPPPPLVLSSRGPAEWAVHALPCNRQWPHGGRGTAHRRWRHEVGVWGRSVGGWGGQECETVEVGGWVDGWMGGGMRAERPTVSVCRPACIRRRRQAERKSRTARTGWKARHATAANTFLCAEFQTIIQFKLNIIRLNIEARSGGFLR
jgi:hypothetical protein